jgi:hypothetical protein
VQTPCVGVTNAIGQLLQQQGTKVALTTSTVVDIEPTFNVIATSKQGDPSKVTAPRGSASRCLHLGPQDRPLSRRFC